MITAEFFRFGKAQGSALSGFSVQGHAGYAPAGEDIVCAAVSSAVKLAANGITEILKADAEAEVLDNQIRLRLRRAEPAADVFLRALRLQLELIAGEYPGCIQVICPEKG